MHVEGQAFCSLCLKGHNDGVIMMACVECQRETQGSTSSSPSSYCSASCFTTHWSTCHRPGVASRSKRPSSGGSSSGSDPGSPPSSFMFARGMQQQHLSPLQPMGYYQQQPFFHHPSPPTHRRGSADGRLHYQQQRSRRA